MSSESIMNVKENSDNASDISLKLGSNEEPFKKPILIGKIGRLPKKFQQTSIAIKDSDQTVHQEIQDYTAVENDAPPSDINSPLKPLVDNSSPLPYEMPAWSGLPHADGSPYQFDVLKNGTIIETIDLMNKPYWIFGRLPNCDIPMQHPTISRYHAVLQYRMEPNNTDSPGFYIYDLGSTHGTFLNKNRIKPKVYIKVHVGHMLKLGCSSRTYILNGPEEDTEEESEFTVTELKQRRAEEIIKFEERQREIEEQKKKEEERGIDWGMGEDADEESDLAENPFAQTTNEELYLDDPKKALRGFFEREGLELEYNCSEQGIGQFLCKVELPVDDERGCPIVAEVIHKGKKKEAVIQCALEACRILDRHGVLRQAVHESRKRKAKNWEENDYYDSDDDTFLDRTGTIEKKREKRMQAKAPQKAETYESLLEKEKEISENIQITESKLFEAQEKLRNESKSTNDEDSLDSFMQHLTESKPDKQTINKLKTELSKLKQEHSHVIKLVNIAKPASLPPLMPQHSAQPSTSGKSNKNNSLPIFGKRKKVKVQIPSKPTYGDEVNLLSMDVEEEEEDDDAEKVFKEKVQAKVEYDNDVGESCIQPCTSKSMDENNPRSSQSTNLKIKINKRQEAEDSYEIPSTSAVAGHEEVGHSTNYSSSDDSEDAFTHDIHNMTFKKFEKLLCTKLIPPVPEKHHDKLATILDNLKRLATSEDRMHVDWKRLVAKKRKVMKLVSDMRDNERDEKMENRVSTELKRILSELNIMMEEKYKVINEVKKMGNEIKSITEEVGNEPAKMKGDGQYLPEGDVSETTMNKGSDETEEEKRKKKNRRRIQQRQDRAEMERQRGYEEDASREDYNMWIPPTDQSGDGRTSLNERYGY